MEIPIEAESEDCTEAEIESRPKAKPQATSGVDEAVAVLNAEVESNVFVSVEVAGESEYEEVIAKSSIFFASD